LVTPFNSTLSSCHSHNNNSYSKRKHSRLSLVAAAALATGALSTAAFGAVATSMHVASGAFAGHAPTAIPNSAGAVAQPATLTARIVGPQDDQASDWGAAASHAVTAEGGGSTQAVAQTQGLAARVPGLVPADVAAVRVPAAQVPAAQALQALNAALTQQGAKAQAPTAQAAPAQVLTAQTPAGHGFRPQTLAGQGNTAPANAAQPAAANGQPTPARAARPHAAPAHPAPSHPAPAPAAPAEPAQPYLIYDSVTPSALPWGHQIATYVNGAYAPAPSAVAGRSDVLWIDTNGSDHWANALDVEPGDATPAGAAQWVYQKLSIQPNSVAIVYTMLSDWQAVKDNVATLPSWMQGKVRYWIADPTGYNHIVPGSNATQWYWGNSYDLTTAYPNFETP
jgi:hypothetical protein